VAARLRVILTDEQLPLQAMARLRQRFPLVAELRHRPPERRTSTADDRRRQMQQAATPFDLSLAFFADQQGRPAEDAEADLLRQALEAASRRGER
jgi:exonuclease SbcD